MNKDMIKCPFCNGTGKKTKEEIEISRYIKCKDSKSDEIESENCCVCNGTGEVQEKDVEIYRVGVVGSSTHYFIDGHGTTHKS